MNQTERTWIVFEHYDCARWASLISHTLYYNEVEWKNGKQSTIENAQLLTWIHIQLSKCRCSVSPRLRVPFKRKNQNAMHIMLIFILGISLNCSHLNTWFRFYYERSYIYWCLLTFIYSSSEVKVGEHCSHTNCHFIFLGWFFFSVENMASKQISLSEHSYFRWEASSDAASQVQNVAKHRVHQKTVSMFNYTAHTHLPYTQPVHILYFANKTRTHRLHWSEKKGPHKHLLT